MPFRRGFSTLGTDIVYDTGDYAGLLDKFLDRVGWEALGADVGAAPARPASAVGLGLGFFVEKSGLGPFDDVRITLGCDGSIEVITGAASIGQGVETVMAQICADGIGIDLDRIRVIHGQTDQIARGMGAFASRVTVMTGAAVSLAAAKLRRELLVVAGRLLQTAPERLSVAGDQVTVTDAPKVPRSTSRRSRAAPAARLRLRPPSPPST